MESGLNVRNRSAEGTTRRSRVLVLLLHCCRRHQHFFDTFANIQNALECSGKSGFVHGIDQLCAKDLVYKSVAPLVAHGSVRGDYVSVRVQRFERIRDDGYADANIFTNCCECFCGKSKVSDNLGNISHN